MAIIGIDLAVTSAHKALVVDDRGGSCGGGYRLHIGLGLRLQPQLRLRLVTGDPEQHKGYRTWRGTGGGG